MNKIKVTAKKEGVVFGSNPSGSVKVSLHGLKKDQYDTYKRGKKIDVIVGNL